MMRKRKWLLLLLAVLTGTSVFAILWWQAEYPSRPALKSQGERMIAAVERYRTQHGEYPATLEDAGITPPSHGYGPWQYGHNDNSFWLIVGDYGKDWFVLSYVSGDRGWYLDH
ncbi:hypothetical protein [Limnoglobus roseus]|uniref:Type II secretion system protein GspG C-terminal domain-containing protein n=1 Tax=Limnoglobus roseus TaxID=2598579 RepID=A0A5C1A7P7_9BACT|nr:hypothetical protein [Limnoglobus roseus]QEL14247.1 hypothetical protein PX52LOC_01117 [Limnoglobus roseus]